MKKALITLSFVFIAFIGNAQGAKDLYIKGVGLFDQHNYPEAITYLSKAISKKPKFKEAYFKRGVSYLLLKDNNKAAEDFTQLILLDPTNDLAYYNRGIAYKEANQLNQALESFNKAIALNANFAEAFYNRGLVKLQLDDIENACPDLSRASDLGIPQAGKLWKYYCFEISN